MSVPVRNVRGPEISFRDPSDKRLIEQAALVSGVTMTAYIRMKALEAAAADAERRNMIVLSEGDFDAFAKELECPSEPNETLVDLFRDQLDES